MAQITLTPISVDGKTAGIPASKTFSTDNILYMSANADDANNTDLVVKELGKPVSKWIVDEAVASIQSTIGTPIQFAALALKFKNGRELDKTVYLNVHRISKCVLDQGTAYSFPGQGDLADRDDAGRPTSTSVVYYHVNQPSNDVLLVDEDLDEILTAVNADENILEDYEVEYVNGRPNELRVLLNASQIVETKDNVVIASGSGTYDLTDIVFQDSDKRQPDIFSYEAPTS